MPGILLKNFNGTDLIQIKRDDMYTAIVIISYIDFSLLFLGIVLETLVIASILRIRSKSVDNLFVLSLCSADLIFNLYMVSVGVIVMNAGGWSIRTNRV